MSGKRLALRFSRGEELAVLAHRDVIAAWEAALAASGLPVATLEGRSAKPRFTIAAPLPAGYTSDAEWVEVLLTRVTAVEAVIAALNCVLPPGLRVLEGKAVEKRSPTLQSQSRWAEYSFTFAREVTRDDVEAAVARFIQRREFPWEETVDGKTKRFDLCALTDDLWVEEKGGIVALGLRLDASGNGTGRPDSVLAGLGLPPPRTKARTRLVFSYLPQALVLWRRSGRFESERPQR